MPAVKKELAQVAAIADELDYQVEKVLMREGEPGREFFILVEGSARVTRGGKLLRRDEQATSSARLP